MTNNPKQAVWKAILDELDNIEFGGEFVGEYGGIPPNTAIEYIASSFLDGLVNYLNHATLEGYLLDRYKSIENESVRPVYADFLSLPTLEDKYKAMAEALGKQSNMNAGTYDDVVLFGETSNSIYMYYYDGDVSDCMIVRVLKETFPELTVESFSKIYREAHTERTSQTFYPIPKAAERRGYGWISF